ncbi:MAG TPA: SGNH/GDSL hydrolase family protein [Bryobacteraceae bacterium]|jgi:lysophospholipase L1-like esterase|nr:SGNH/GDSL hydrolase family protein [Bryobacteraceae bacterium]
MAINKAFVRVFRTRFITLLALHLMGVCALVASGSASDGHGFNEHWVATWSTTLTQSEVIPGLSNAGFNNQTLRQIVHASIGGRRVRVRLSAFGASGLLVGSAHIALSAGGASVVSGSDRVLTFGRNPSITIPSGAPVLSDPVDLTVPEAADLAITLFLPGMTGPATWHFDARQTSYISPSGNFATSSAMPLDALTPTTTSWFWIAGVDVLASRESDAIAALGESVTDGAQSTVDANHRWPDYLARRLMNRWDGPGLSVLNEGLDGNRLLHDELGPNGLSRFDRDVLSQPGLAYVIVLAAANDIGTGWPGGIYPDQEVSAEQIVQAFRQLIARAHTAGLKIFGGTIMPTKGFLIPGTQFPVYSPGNEAKRQQVNYWIRTSYEFDGVIDFDRVLRDPNDPARLLPHYDSGDHAHPTDQGYEAMADAIDLKLFRKEERH